MNILLVDDHDDVRESLSEVLSHSGHNVTEASDGVQADEFLEKNKYDVIVTDIMMPNKTGFDLITETKEKNPKMKIIAISGGGNYLTSDLTKHLASMRADKALSKPFMPEQILEAIKEVTSES